MLLDACLVTLSLIFGVVSTRREPSQIIISDSSLAAIDSLQLDDNSNLIFASFLGLLQQWPNSFAPSGHSIIPGIIPRATKLYHGTTDAQPPPGPEWLAFDPEYSYNMVSRALGDAWIHTFVTERPIRVIYLDGQSASFCNGCFDSQGVLVNGTVVEKITHDFVEELHRAHGLCDLGKEWGFEGIVRMNAGLELIMCDFTRGIKLFERMNVTDPFSKPGIPTFDHLKRLTAQRPPGQRPTSPFFSNGYLRFGEAAARHYEAPGEGRVVLDPSAFISFYDRIDSLTKKRHEDGTQDSHRSLHRLFGISPSDAAEIRERLRKVLARKNAESWKLSDDRVDWRTVAMTISQRYTHQLGELRYMLERSTDPIKTAMEVRQSTYAMLMPYLDFTHFSRSEFSWIKPGIELCSSDFMNGPFSSQELTESVHGLRRAIRGTLSRICGIVGKIFEDTLRLDLPIALGASSSVEDELNNEINGWKEEVTGLIKWLGWATGERCDPNCTGSEICMAPLWPLVSIDKPVVDLSDYRPVCKDLHNLSTSVGLLRALRLNFTFENPSPSFET